MQRACRNGTDTIQRILENDRCLFNGISISDVHLDNTQASQEELIQIEASESVSNSQHLKVLADRGKTDGRSAYSGKCGLSGTASARL